MQMKLELFSTEIASAMENKDLLSLFRVYKKSATSAQTDGWITTDGPFYTGGFCYISINFCTSMENVKVKQNKSE